MDTETSVASIESDVPASFTITLRTPATFATLKYTELRLREPTAAEMMQWASLSGADAEIKAVSVVSGLPIGAIDEIGARDMATATNYLARFLPTPAQAQDPADLPETLIVPLRSPITWPPGAADAETYTELKLREPLAKEMRAWDGLSGIEADVTAVATITGIDKLAIRQMGIRDLRKASDYLTSFFAYAPTAGATS